MSNISGGKITYTVHIDNATLKAAMQALQALAQAAGKAGQGFTNANKPLSQFEQAAFSLSKRIETLNNDFNSGKINTQQYVDGMQKAEQRATQLRGRFEALRGSIVTTGSDSARASGLMASLSGAMLKTANATGGSKAAADKLGLSFRETVGAIQAINSEIRAATQAFDASQIKSTEYAQVLTQLQGRLTVLNSALDQYRNSARLTTAEQNKLTIATGQVQRGMTAATKGKMAATGEMNRMAHATRLNQGALVLLNDRIFKLSPALGILTNTLIYSTKSVKAFLAAAWPIIVVAGGILAAVAAIRSSVRAAVEIEKAWADVAKTTNFTNRELRDITKTFQGLAKEIPVSTMELLEIAKVAGLLGIQGVENIEKFTEAIAKLSIATDVVGEEGALSLARFLQATGVANEDLGSIALQTGNILNELGNTTASTAGEILKATSYTQGLASQANASRAEILGLNAALLSLGVKAEAGGSAVVRTVGKIQVATAAGGRELANFAMFAQMSVEEFSNLVDDSPIQALLALSEGLNQAAASGTSLNSVLTELGIREVRERRTLLALAQGVDTFRHALDTANKEAMTMTSLQKEVDRMSSIVSARTKVLGERFTILAQQLGVVLLPLVAGLVEILIVLTDTFILLFQSIGDLVKEIYYASGGFRDMTAEIEKLQSSQRASERQTNSLGRAMHELSNLTGDNPNGLTRILGDLFATMDEDGKEAFARFRDSTLQPLLAQGMLKEAITETIQEFARLSIASKKAERDTAQAIVSAARRNFNVDRLASLDVTIAKETEIFQFLDRFIDLIRIGTDESLAAARAMEEASNILAFDMKPGRKFDPFDIDKRAEALKMLGQEWEYVSDSLAANIEERDRILEDSRIQGTFALALEARLDVERLNAEIAELEQLAIDIPTLSPEELRARIEATAAFNFTIPLGVDFDEDKIILDVEEVIKKVEGAVKTAEIELEFKDPDFTELDFQRALFKGYEDGVNSLLAILLQLREEGKEVPELLSDTLDEYIAKMRAAGASVDELSASLRSSSSNGKSQAEMIADVYAALEAQLEFIRRSSIDQPELWSDVKIAEESLRAYQSAIDALIRLEVPSDDIGFAGLIDQWGNLTGKVFDYQKEVQRIAEIDQLRASVIGVFSDMDKAIESAANQARLFPDEFTEGKLLEARIAAIQSAILSLSALGLSDEEIISTGIFEALSLSQTLLKAFNAEQKTALEFAEKNERIKKIYEDLGETIDRNNIKVKQLGMSERDRIQANITASERALEQLLAVEGVDALSPSIIAIRNDIQGFQEDLDALDARESMQNIERLVSRVYRNLSNQRAEIRDEGLIVGRTEAQSQRLELALIGASINELLSEGVKLNNVTLSNLISEFSTLSAALAESGEDFDELADDLAKLRASVSGALSEDDLSTLKLFERLKEEGMSYAEVLQFAEDQGIELGETLLELVRITFGISSAALAAERSFKSYDDSVSTLGRNLRVGLINETEYYNGIVRAARRNLETVAAATGEFSDETKRAGEELKRAQDALSAYVESTDDLTLRLELGLITQQEFLKEQINRLNASLLEASKTFGVVSDEVEELRREIEKLKEELQEVEDAEKEVENVFRKIASVSSGLGKAFNDLAADITDAIFKLSEGTATMGETIGVITSSVRGLLPEVESVGGQAIEAITGIAASILDKLIPGLGQAVAAVGSFIAALFDIGSSARRARNQVFESFRAVDVMTEATAKALSNLRGTTKTVRRDGILGWLGFKKTVVDEAVVNEIIQIFNEIGGSIAGALSSGIDAAMNDEDWEQIFEETFKNNILNMIKQTFIEATLLTSGFQDVMLEFTKIMRESGSKAAFDFLAGRVPQIMEESKKAIEEFAKFVPEAFKIGEDAWLATEKNIKRIKGEIEGSSRFLDEALIDTLIQLATIEEEVNKVAFRAAKPGERGIFGFMPVVLESVKDFKRVIDEAALNALVTLAEGIAQGIQNGFRSGIDAMVKGDADWREKLKESIKSTIVGSMIDAFIASAAVQGIVSGFVADFVTAINTGDENAADFAKRNVADAVNNMAQLIEGFVDALPAELLPSTNPRSPDYRPDSSTRRSRGTTVSEITGPTRDLFLDLLGPLSILPSWTGMIQDIRNDVRTIANMGSAFQVPNMQMATTSMAIPQSSVSNVTTVTIQNATITTEAQSAKELYDEISKQVYRDLKAGRGK